MRKWSSNILLALVLLGASGCYEGWDYEQKGGNDGKDQPPPPPPAIPPIFYILFQPIVLSGEAIDDGGCFAQTGISGFRKSEWSERIQALTDTLRPLAQNFKVAPITVGKDDCDKLAAVRSAAIDPKPWAPDPEPADDPLDRSLVDVRAVFWEDDVTGTDAPGVVLARQWVAFANMAKAGRKAKTVNHFVLEHEAVGYFHDWHEQIAPDDRADGTPINTIDASDAGIAARAGTIKADAGTVAKWLMEHP